MQLLVLIAAAWLVLSLSIAVPIGRYLKRLDR